MDVATAVDRLVKEISLGMADATVHSYNRAAKVIKDHFEGVSVSEIDIARLLVFRDDAYARYKPNLATQARRLFRRVLDLAVAAKVISRNPYEAMPPRATPERMSQYRPLETQRLVIPSRDTFKRLLRHPAVGPAKTVVMLALLAGLRIGEILGLKWESVKWDDGDFGQLDIVTSRATRMKDGSVKTFFSNRRVDLALELRHYLLDLCGGTERRDAAYVCVDAKGKQLIFETATRWMKQLQVDAGIGARLPPTKNCQYRYEGVTTTHGLRHACAAFWIWIDIDDVVISEWLGHSDPVFTMGVYGYLFAAREEGGYEWPTVIQSLKGAEYA